MGTQTLRERHSRRNRRQDLGTINHGKNPRVPGIQGILNTRVNIIEYDT